jgi:hypothetical protein
VPDPKKEFIKKAQITRQVLSRDLGIGLFSTNSYGELAFSVLNGAGINTPEDNSRKDIVGRAVFIPIKHTKVGGSFLIGWSGSDDSLVEKNRFNIQTEYKTNSLHIRAEYLYAIDGETNCKGYYLQTGYKFHLIEEGLDLKAEPLIRYEKFDPIHSVNDDSFAILTLGLNFYFREPFVKLLLNYLRKANESDGVQNGQFLCAIQVVF